MAELSQNPSVLEAELTELSRQIDEKRAQLEESRGMVVEHKEAIREVVGKEVFGESYVPTTAPPASQPTTPATSATPSKPSYLDRLDAQSVVIINELIQALPKDGLKKTIAHAKNLSPFMLDAFHDVLIDKLYEELRKNNLIR